MSVFAVLNAFSTGVERSPNEWTTTESYSEDDLDELESRSHEVEWDDPDDQDDDEGWEDDEDWDDDDDEPDDEGDDR